MKKNDNVTSLTIHTDYDYREKGAYENFKNLVKVGFQNKPNLKKLEIIGDFDVRLWFQIPQDERHIWGTLETKERMKTPWFSNLEQFIINGDAKGTMNDYVNFGCLVKEASNLKKLEVTGSSSPDLSFDRP